MHEKNDPKQQTTARVKAGFLDYSPQEQQIEALLALHRISLELHGQFDLQKLLERITQQGAQLLGTSSGGLYLFDVSSQALELVVSHNTGRDFRGVRMALGEGLAGQVAQSLKPMFVADYDQWEGRAAQWTGVIKSVLAMPLVWRGELVGVITAAELERKRAFSQIELDMLQLFADQAAAAIVNAQMRGALAESEQRYRNLVESALVGVYLIQDGKITYVNQKACEISGYAAEEMLGKSPVDFVVPQERARITAILQSQFSSPAQQGIVTTIRKDGKIIEVEFLVRWAEVEGKRVLIGTAVDITPQRETERLRQKLIQMGRDILGSSELRKILKDVVDAIVTYSPFKVAGIAVYDRPVRSDEISGYHIQELFSSGLEDPLREKLEGRIVSGDFVPHHEILAKGLKIGPNSYFITPHQIPEVVEKGVPVSVQSSSQWGLYDTLFIFLVNEGRLLGRIGVSAPMHGHLPTPQEIEAMEILANMAALALAKAQNLSALRSAVSQLQHMNEFLKLLNEARDIEEVLQVVLHRGFELIPRAQGGSIVLLNQQQHLFEFRASIGRELHRLQQVQFPAQATIRALRLDQGPRILTRSVQQQDPHWKQLAQKLGPTPAATIILPITREQQIIGVLNLNHFEDEAAFKQTDIERISALLPEIQLAISRVQDHEQLREQALHDALTGVYNRRYLNELILGKLKNACDRGQSFALLMIDFDNFYLINDQLGHSVGDQALVAFAAFLKKAVRSSDAIVRYGGDEFLVILMETDQEHAELIAKRLEEASEHWLEEFNRQHSYLDISISIGLAFWTPESGKDIHAILEEADQFMYRRKRSKRTKRPIETRKHSA